MDHTALRPLVEVRQDEEDAVEREVGCRFAAHLDALWRNPVVSGASQPLADWLVATRHR